MNQSLRDCKYILVISHIDSARCQSLNKGRNDTRSIISDRQCEHVVANVARNFLIEKGTVVGNKDDVLSSGNRARNGYYFNTRGSRKESPSNPIVLILCTDRTGE